MPTPWSRAFSQSGDGATVTFRERARREARAQIGIVDRDVHELARRRAGRRLGLALVERAQAQVEDRRDIARDAPHREQVGAVREDLEVEHHVAQRDARGERLARRPRVAEDQDAAVLVRDLELALGEDHAVRERAAQPRALERPAVGHAETGRGHGDGVARAEVPCAADDLAGLCAPGVDLAELQAVGVRMRVRLEHEAREHEAVEPVLRRAGRGARSSRSRPRRA